ncbi:MAG: hypothetical protein AB7O24_25675 [Kofleriaceae bacterium]
MTMTRKDFLISVAGAAGLAAVVGCGGSDEGDDDDGMNDMCTSPNVGIGANHDEPHEVTVSITDVNAGADKTYTLSNVGHTHTFTVTAAQFAMLAQRQSVMITSSNEGVPAHTHQITVTCTS